jgi:negative regulator of replication initiation
MKAASIFLESFLDGLGIAGFGPKLRRPGAPTRLFAAEDDEIAAMDTETSIAANALRESLDSGDFRRAEDAARVFVNIMESKKRTDADSVSGSQPSAAGELSQPFHADTR